MLLSLIEEEAGNVSNGNVLWYGGPFFILGILYIEKASFGSKPCGEEFFCEVFGSCCKADMLSGSGNGLLMRDAVGIIAHRSLHSSWVGLVRVDVVSDRNMVETELYELRCFSSEHILGTCLFTVNFNINKHSSGWLLVCYWLPPHGSFCVQLCFGSQREFVVKVFRISDEVNSQQFGMPYQLFCCQCFESQIRLM